MSKNLMAIFILEINEPERWTGSHGTLPDAKAEALRRGATGYDIHEWHHHASTRSPIPDWTKIKVHRFHAK